MRKPLVLVCALVQIRRIQSFAATAAAAAAAATVPVAISARFRGSFADPGAVGDALMELGALSVSVTDRERGTDSEKPIFHEPTIGEPGEWERRIGGEPAAFWKRSEITAIFPLGWDIAGTATLAKDVLELPEALEFELVEVEERDWVADVQQAWEPVALPGLTVRFPWHDAPAAVNDGTLDLLLEGGSAFGTGEHATTAMCCSWLRKRLVEAEAPVRVLDYGSGSGILTLAALRFGASEAVGVELDLDATAAALRNAAANDLSAGSRFLYPGEVHSGERTTVDLLPVAAEPGSASGSSVSVDSFASAGVTVEPFDVTVANILAGTLLRLRPTLAALTKEGGSIGLSGILAEQGAVVAEEFSVDFEDVKVEEELRGWVLITGKKRKMQ